MSAVAKQAGLALLVLFGSRARRQARPDSDWDFGFLVRPGGSVDVEGLRLHVSEILRSDDIDLVDLARASALLRFRVAAEGSLIHEAAPDLFRSFKIDTATFWCDVEPVLRIAYARVLKGVGAR